MKSCLYRGWVRHRRLSPKAHAFRYGLYMVCIDLAEIDAPKNLLLRMWRSRFRRTDHFGDPKVSLFDSVKQLVSTELGLEVCNVCLVTNLRHGGYVMNPVSFFHCFDSEQRWIAVVAEVHNTPWGETHTYALRAEEGAAVGTFAKEFHVSPFMPMDQSYRWRFSRPDDDLVVHMENWADDAKVFDATLVMKRRPATVAEALSAAIRFPAMSQLVIFRIYWQALRLWLKRIPTHPHPVGGRR